MTAADNLDIRWKQRFLNFEKAFLQLSKFQAIEELNEFEAQGFIKSFEYTYELSWNVMKDYLLHQGVVGITGSRDAFRQAFHKGLIDKGEHWMQMVDDRIRTVHTYDADIAAEVIERITKRYFPCFEKFYKSMKERL